MGQKKVHQKFDESIKWYNYRDSSDTIATKNINRLSIHLYQSLSILHIQDLPGLPVLQATAYYIYHTLRNDGRIQYKLNWMGHRSVAIIDDHQGHIIRGDAQNYLN